MNDFTLEELHQICYLANYYIDMNGSVGNINYVLRDKSNVMIDNYCEHKWSCWDDEHNTRECLKCGEKRTGEI